MFDDYDDLPEPDLDYDEPDDEPLGAYIGGRWVDV